MTKFVTVKFRLPGFHYWPDAPIIWNYLKNLHRHEFHFTIWLEVFHNDRELEFIALKEELHAFTEAEIVRADHLFSCEMLAEQIGAHFDNKYPNRSYRIWVEEDGENGAFAIQG